MQPSLTVHFEPKPKPPHKVCSTQHTKSIQKPPLDAAAGRRPKRRPLSSARRPYRFAPRLRVTQLTKGKTTTKRKRQAAAENSKSRPALPCRGVLIFTHSSLFRRSSRRFVVRARLSVPREQKENSGGKPRVQVAFFRADFLATGFLCCADFCKRRGRRVCVRENREQNFACCVNNSFPGGNSRDKGFPRVGPGGLA